MLVEKDRKAERVLIDITKVQQKSQAAADNAQVTIVVGSNLNPGVNPIKLFIFIKRTFFCFLFISLAVL